MNTGPLRIALSARLMHDPPAVLGFRNRTLQYLEQTIAHWIMGHGALAFMLPTLGYDAEVSRRKVSVHHYVDAMDGLLIQGGADVSPTSYGQQPLRPEWSGDRVRDRYEIELLDGFVARGKPVLGICRGLQLINVAYGGTLLAGHPRRSRPDARQHVDAELYDQHHHDVAIEPGTRLAAIYEGVSTARRQQHPPPGHRPPRRRRRRRGALARGRRDRGDPRARLEFRRRRAVASRVPHPESGAAERRADHAVLSRCRCRHPQGGWRRPAPSRRLTRTGAIMASPAKKPRRTAERILEATLDLFNRFGEPNVSTTAISAELGISPGNLYYHYPAKEELVNRLFARYETALVRSAEGRGRCRRRGGRVALLPHAVRADLAVPLPLPRPQRPAVEQPPARDPLPGRAAGQVARGARRARGAHRAGAA